MPNFTDAFQFDFENCNEINNAGSALYVTNLVCPNDEPAEVTLNSAAGVTTGAESITVTNPLTTEMYLRRGGILHFGTAPNFVAVVVDEDVTLAPNADTAVAIAPAPADIAAGTSAITYGLQRVLPPINIPTNLTAQEENRTDLSTGLKGSMVKTKIEANFSITVFNNVSDRALWQSIFPSAQSDRSIYALVVRSSGVHTFGRALVSNWNDDGNVESLSKPQFEIKFQGQWAATSPYRWLTADQQTSLNAVRRLAGLTELTV